MSSIRFALNFLIFNNLQLKLSLGLHLRVIFEYKPKCGSERSAMGYMMDRYLDQLIIELGLEPLPKDRSEIKLTLNPTLKITVRELDPGLLFFSPLGPLPTKQKEKVLQHAMQANYLGQGTGGGVLGIDEEEKHFTLTTTHAFDMNYQTFRDAISDFANYVDYLKEELKQKELE